MYNNCLLRLIQFFKMITQQILNLMFTYGLLLRDFTLECFSGRSRFYATKSADSLPVELPPA